MTPAPEQLPLDQLYVPPATPATHDLVCWLWAAFPPREGRLHIRTIATALGVSDTTVRRWIRTASDRQLVFDSHTQRRLQQRAILRGRGHYLWPDLDAVSRARGDGQLRHAERAHHLISTEPERIPPAWRTNGTLQEHLVHLVHYKRAHVYGIVTSRTPKTDQRIRQFGTVLATITTSSKYEAHIIRELTLRTRDAHRCVVPDAYVPLGRTETWREAGGTAAFIYPPKT